MNGNRTRALENLKVLEFTIGGAGPWIGRILAYHGATTIRIESRHSPDVIRTYVPPHDRKQGVQPDLSPWLAEWHGGKLHAALDLRKPKAVELAKRLAAQADIVIENFKAGTIDRLGLGYNCLRKLNPRLIMISLSGFGQTGPYKEFIAWGPNIESLAGMSSVTGYPDGPPVESALAYADWIAGGHGLVAVLAAVHNRERTGEGQYIDLSLLESLAATHGEVFLEYAANGRDPGRNGNDSPIMVPHDVYPCAGEDRWVAIAVRDTEEWYRLCELLDRKDWILDQRLSTREGRRAQIGIIDSVIADWSRLRTPDHAMHDLQTAGIPAGAVRKSPDLLTDPHLQARQQHERAPHLRLGWTLVNAFPGIFSATPGRTDRTGANLGEDNRRVFCELLGMDEAEYGAACAEGAIESSDLTNRRPEERVGPRGLRSQEVKG